MPTWPEQTIFWHVYPLGFTGAEREALPPDATPVPRLRQLERWLDYLIELGANGLALGPVFASATHGYDTTDHLRVDPRLGTDDDLAWLVTACHERGIRVLLDGVFNHVGEGFPAFQDVLVHGRHSRYADWFRIDWDADTERGFDHADFEGHHHLVALDHTNPAVVDHVVTVMEHWLAAGADGWRLDAAYAVPQVFWREVTDRVRARFPDAWFVGEVIHAPYVPWITDAHLDAITQYELWKAIWSGLNDRNLYELAHALERHREVVEAAPPMTFLGNHDVTRIATQLGDDRHLTHALVLLLTLPGIPSIYAGDEQGFTGEKQEHAAGDDAVRPAFPPSPDELLPFGRPLLHCHQELIGVRRRHPWLVTAELEVLLLDNAQLAYVARPAGTTSDAAATADHLVVLLNLADTPTRFDAARDALPGAHATVATGGSDDDPTHGNDTGDGEPDHDDHWTLGPHRWRILARAD
jgi:cyclomaltodextrinase / maltogenic alpha-amylase / neopullulanase